MLINAKLIIIGHARHGKDTVANKLAHNLGLENVNASTIACNEIIYPVLNSFYSDPEECYNDRINNRELWYRLINHYCLVNGGHAFGFKVFEQSDIYAGVRDEDEHTAILNAAELYSTYPIITIWVDAARRLPLEDEKSINITADKADFILCNNGDIDNLTSQIDMLSRHLTIKYGV